MGGHFLTSYQLAPLQGLYVSCWVSSGFSWVSALLPPCLMTSITPTLSHTPTSPTSHSVSTSSVKNNLYTWWTGHRMPVPILQVVPVRNRPHHQWHYSCDPKQWQFSQPWAWSQAPMMHVNGLRPKVIFYQVSGTVNWSSLTYSSPWLSMPKFQLKSKM